MNNRFYKIGAGIGIALIALVITFIVLTRKNDNEVAEIENTPSSVMSSTNIVDGNSLTIDTKSKNFNEINNNNEVNSTETNIETKTENKEEPNKNTITNTKSNTSTEKKDEETNQDKTNEEAPVKKEETEKKDPVFTYPVKGEIIADYAKDKLIYSNTLGEWITHFGIDIKAAKTTVVTASADGTVKSIKNDPRYGLTVVIEHANDFSTVYSNLLTAEFVSTGEKVKSGQTIGTVGNTASFEILDESHLHFEILKSGEQIDPNMYLKN